MASVVDKATTIAAVNIINVAVALRHLTNASESVAIDTAEAGYDSFVAAVASCDSFVTAEASRDC